MQLYLQMHRLKADDSVSGVPDLIGLVPLGEHGTRPRPSVVRGFHLKSQWTGNNFRVTSGLRGFVSTEGPGRFGFCAWDGALLASGFMAAVL